MLVASLSVIFVQTNFMHLLGNFHKFSFCCSTIVKSAQNNLIFLQPLSCSLGQPLVVWLIFLVDEDSVSQRYLNTSDDNIDYENYRYLNRLVPSHLLCCGQSYAMYQVNGSRFGVSLCLCSKWCAVLNFFSKLLPIFKLPE